MSRASTRASKCIAREFAIRKLETLIKMAKDGDETTQELQDAREAIEAISDNVLTEGI